jgi:hypothetical protein
MLNLFQHPSGGRSETEDSCGCGAINAWFFSSIGVDAETSSA